MRNFYLAIFLIVGFLAEAQPHQIPKDSQGKRHGQWIKYHANGKIRYTGTFRHGIPVDTFKYYFEDGALRTKNVFEAKSGNCLSYQYGEKQILAAKGRYVNKLKEGPWTFYNQQGNTIAEENYAQGKKSGTSKKFHDNGKLAESFIYVNDLKEGAWLQFYDTGAKMTEGNYKGDKLAGEITYFYSSGKPRVKGQYRNGLMHGTWYYFKDQLKLDRKETWHYGKKIEPKPEEEAK